MTFDNSEFRLSRLQKHVWTLAQETGELPYRIQVLVKIRGRLRPLELRRALHVAVERHEILRTTFRCREDFVIPSQVIRPPAFSWQVVDLRDVDLDREQFQTRIFEHELTRPFNLSDGPSLRVLLMLIDAHHSSLLLALPSLCGDRQTLEILVDEIRRSYQAVLTAERLNDDPVQYVQFSEWHHEILNDEAASVGNSFWLEQPATAGVNWLPLEKRRVNAAYFEPKSVSIEVDPEFSAALHASASACGVAAGTVLLGCWQVLIWRLTGATRSSIDVMVDGREYDELQHALGLFARRLPVAISFDNTYRFHEVVLELEKTLRETLEWQDYFEQAGTELLAQSYESVGFESYDCPVKVESEPSFLIAREHVVIDRCKLQLSAAFESERLLLEIYYDAQSFNPEDVLRTGEQFLVLARSAVRDSSQLVSALPLLTGAERSLISSWNETRVNYPADETLHGLFEAQVQKTPQSIALVSGGRSKTYAELNECADRFAEQLRCLGVGPECVTGVYAERSIEFVVGILAVLKAGAAYLPLEPPMPPERLDFIQKDSGASVFLTTKALHQFLPPEVDAIYLDQPDHNAVSNVQNTRAAAGAENLCYLIYTSGSTGAPKAVAVEHRQISNYVHALLERLDLPSGSQYALASTFAADLGHSVVFASLMSGGGLHVLSAEQALDADRFAEYFATHQIDCVKIVPSHLRALLRGARGNSVLPRQRLLLGGEALDWSLVNDIRKIASELRIFNHYGPTETTVGVLVGEVKDSDVRQQSTTVLLGHPVANARVYVLDQSMRRVPIGCAGELYIGGAGVARGYLKRGELTAARFIPDPFTSEKGARLYRSGDLVRQLPDGQIEFLGRIDRQLKIRGFRLELGEIEAVLTSHPKVSDAAVLCRERHATIELTAYLVCRDQALIKAEELEAFLQAKLPPQMVPTSFVFVTQLPLTANGKLDYKALAAAAEAQQRSEQSYVAPRSEIEARLAQIMGELLSLERPGIHDNFFRIGGHSLLATQFMSIVRDTFQVEISLQRFFEQPTVSELAVMIVQSQSEQAGGEESERLLAMLEQLTDDEALLSLSEISEMKVSQTQTLSE